MDHDLTRCPNHDPVLCSYVVDSIFVLGGRVELLLLLFAVRSLCNAMLLW